MKQLKPLGDNVLVDLDPKEEISKGGIHIPKQAQDESVWGITRAVGGEVEDVKEGDKVFVPSHVGTSLVIEGTKHVILRESQILAKRTT